MTEANEGSDSLPERIDLARADDPRDVVHRAVASLAQGEGVILSVGGLTGFAAGALRPEAVRLLKRPDSKADAPGSPALLLRGGDEVGDWVPDLTPLGSRLARRAWPGPMTLVCPTPRGPSLFDRLPAEVGDYLREGDGVAFGVPAQPFVRDVLRLLPGPVVFRPIPMTVGLDQALRERGGHFPLMIESDAGAAGNATTVVRIGPDGWSVLAPGSLDEPALTRMAGLIVLFVCTGNTCRSPMAEAICKVLLSERLGCTVGALESRGYVIVSAGIAASAGMPAAANAIEVVRARGGSLANHASQRLTLDLVRHADIILAMTADHLDALVENVPEVAPRARLLHPDGDDVSDPVGADLPTYRRTAEAIESYLVGLLDELGV